MREHSQLPGETLQNIGYGYNRKKQGTQHTSISQKIFRGLTYKTKKSI